MNFGWETQEEKLLRYMKVPPKKRLEWLWQMHELMRRALTKTQKDNFFKLREEGRI